MTVGFFTVMRRDPQHFLHATNLVAAVRQTMPEVPIVQFTDPLTPAVEGVDRRVVLPDGPMLERRLEHYAACEGEWLFLDTDTHVARDVRAVFDDPVFDVALVDRQWPHLPQGDQVLWTMPFNTGVVWSRQSAFWTTVLHHWRQYPDPERADWMSEQRAVYDTVRTGHYRVKILPGMCYNYPPIGPEDAPATAAILHYKGPQRKQWLTDRCSRSWREPV